VSGNSVIDPVTGKPRLLSEMCTTCVFRPGNLMKLRPGRLEELIRENTGPDAQGLHCHQTLEYGGNPDFGLAFCRGFYDGFRDLVNFFRICKRLGGFTEVNPPGEDVPS
jgi:hypothetical protein